MSKTFAIVLALALAGACKKKEDTKASSSAAQSAPSGTQPGQIPARTAPMRRQIVPITVEEVQGMMPTLDGGRVLKAVGKAPRGERVEATICFDKATELTPIADQLKAKLTASGWPTVNIRQHPQITERVGVNANRPPYIFYGSIQRGPYPECSKDKGQTLVTLSVHKIETVQGTFMPNGPRIPGAPGVRGQLPMRPNAVPVAPPAPGGAAPPPSSAPPAQPTTP